MKKNKLIYKIITIITLAVPLPLYLFLSATLFNIDADVTFKNVDSEDLIVNETYIYTNNEDALYEGVFAFEDDEYVFYYDNEDIIKVDDGFFSVREGELVDIKALEVQKELGYKLPMAFFISLTGVGIVFLVVSGKMQWYKKYPRISTLVALLTGTVVLLIIDTIVSNLLGVFMIASISWALYCLEYWVNNNFITEEEGKKAESDLVSSLKKALGGDK